MKRQKNALRIPMKEEDHKEIKKKKSLQSNSQKVGYYTTKFWEYIKEIHSGMLCIWIWKSYIT